MSDIFREVEEDVRRERVEKLWKEYGDYVIAAVALIVIGIAGWQLWQRYEADQRLKASGNYNIAEQIFENSSSQAAVQAFGKIAKEAPGGYAQVARLQQANALLVSGQRADAVALYKQIANDSDPLLAGVARLRAAWAIVDSAPKSEVQTLLAPLTDPTSGWRFLAREVLAYDDYRLGNTRLAMAEYEKLGADKDAPSGVRQRSMAMAVYLKAGGDANVGTVPPPPPSPAAPNVIAPGIPAPAAPTPNAPPAPAPNGSSPQ